MVMKLSFFYSLQGHWSMAIPAFISIIITFQFFRVAHRPHHHFCYTVMNFILRGIHRFVLCTIFPFKKKEIIGFHFNTRHYRFTDRFFAFHKQADTRPGLLDRQYSFIFILVLFDR